MTRSTVGPAIVDRPPAERPTPGAAPLSAIDGLRVEAHADRIEVVATVPIRPDEPNLRGHFPGFPVFPGVFVIEALGQAVDVALREPGARRLLLRGIDSVRFLAPLLPPDVLTLDIKAVPNGCGWAVSARGRRADATVTVQLRARFGGRDA